MLKHEFLLNFPMSSIVIPYPCFCCEDFGCFGVTWRFCNFPMSFQVFFHHFSIVFERRLGQATLGIAAAFEGQRQTEVGRGLLCRQPKRPERDMRSVRSSQTSPILVIVQWVLSLPDSFFWMNIHILVGGLEHFLFFHILGISSSQFTNSYLFQGCRHTNHQSV